MMKNNIFKFSALLVSLGLLLSLLVSGCGGSNNASGDRGGYNWNEYDSSITYHYTVVSKEISKSVYTVDYAVCTETGNTVATFTKGMAEEVVLQLWDYQATQTDDGYVEAIYRDKNGNMIAFGQDKLVENWYEKGTVFTDGSEEGSVAYDYNSDFSGFTFYVDGNTTATVGDDSATVLQTAYISNGTSILSLDSSVIEYTVEPAEMVDSLGLFTQTGTATLKYFSPLSTSNTTATLTVEVN